MELELWKYIRMNKFEVTYYIQVKQTVVADTKKEAKEVILNTPFLDLMETIILPASILVDEPKKIKEIDE